MNHPNLPLDLPAPFDLDFLPRSIEKVIVPPVKCQGIKTKLVPFIASSLSWKGKGKWVEPFLGSGVVAFNVAPERALLGDTNKHIVNFYNRIRSGGIDHVMVREALEEMGNNLSKRGEDFYYTTRDRFNKKEDSLLFLFLNRACFNGIMRFNSKGGYNVPFGKKPNRFSKGYVTKIVNQVKHVSDVMKDKDWQFIVSDWRGTLSRATSEDFVYMDPPYIGRHADYFNTWSSQDAIELAKTAQQLECPYALSMWLENKYRRNDHIKEHWTQTEIKTFNHFYHVGSTESLRNEITEALVISGTTKTDNVAVA